MALDLYLQRTQLLLSDASFEIFNEGDLTDYVNMARGQIAGETECIRVNGTLAVAAATQEYPFSSITLGGLTSAGVSGPIAVRQISYAVASGKKMLTVRPYPWFNTFVLAQPVPTAGPPSTWSQYGQGALGTIFVNLLDGPYTLTLDTVCYPVQLADDSTVEAIPYQFTDAVPWFAAYFAAMTVGAQDQAKTFFEEFEKFVRRGRGSATPSVLSSSFAQPTDPFAQNRLGLQPRGQGQQ